MPQIYLEAHGFPVTNEVKIGVGVSDSCDRSLRHLGSFDARPGESPVLVATVDETTEIYWKNPKELYWTHATVWDFDDSYTMNSSYTESSDVPVDFCNRQNSPNLFPIKPLAFATQLTREITKSTNPITRNDQLAPKDGFVEIVGQLRRDMPKYTIRLMNSDESEFLQIHEEDICGAPLNAGTLNIGDGRRVHLQKIKVKTDAAAINMRAIKVSTICRCARSTNPLEFATQAHASHTQGEYGDRARTIRVSARQEWQNTSISVPANTLVRMRQVDRSDRWVTHPDKGPSSAGGFPDVSDSDTYLCPGCHVGALVAKIENASRSTIGEIGVRGEILAPHDGPLYLAANDDRDAGGGRGGFGDNHGSLEISIELA